MWSEQQEILSLEEIEIIEHTCIIRTLTVIISPVLYTDLKHVFNLLHAVHIHDMLIGSQSQCFLSFSISAFV